MIVFLFALLLVRAKMPEELLSVRLSIGVSFLFYLG